MHRITIDKKDNGFVVKCEQTWQETETEMGGSTQEMVVEISDDKPEREALPEALHSLLWMVMNMLEEWGSKYDERRCVVNIRHGENYECEDDECFICEDAKWDCKKCNMEEG